MIETDSATTTGMSGGMVTLGNTSNLIGIVAGADTDPATGLPNFYGVLPAHLLANAFPELQEEKTACTPKARLTKEYGRDINWRAGDGPLSLEMHKDEGFCYITHIWGLFDNQRDSVFVSVNRTTGLFELNGIHEGPGRHGAYARCIRF